MTLLATNKDRLIISLILFFVKSISEFFCVLTFKEILMRYKDSQKLHKTILNSFSLFQLIIFMLVNKSASLISSRQILFYVMTLSHYSTVQLNCLIFDKLINFFLKNKNLEEK